MNKVIVTVIGRQKDAAGEENSIKMVAQGKHYCRNGMNYVLYEDTSLSGEQGTSTLLKIADDSLTLLRQGAVVQEQYFAKAEESASVYKTPYGELNLSIKTKDIDIVYGSISGNISINYDLSINGQWQSSNTLQIDICADQTENKNLN